MSISESFAVSMMIGTVERVRISRHTSVPGSPGSMRSSSTRSAPLRSNASMRRRAVCGDLHLVPLALEQEAQWVAQRDLVFDEQDAGHLGSPRSAVATRAADRQCAPCGVRCAWSWSCAASVDGREPPPDPFEAGFSGFSGLLRRLLGLVLGLLGSGRRAGLGARESDHERRAAARPRPDAHVAAVVLHGVLDDAEAEPGSARVARAGLVDAVEALEDAVEVLPLDAHALVGDGDLDRVAHHLRADADPAALVASRRSRSRSGCARRRS